MKKALAALGMLVFSITMVRAQSLVTSYLEGDVQIRTGASWTTLSVGDPVPADASIRVTGTGSVQLKGLGADFYLNRAGTYAIRDVLAARQKVSSTGIGNALTRSFRYLFVGGKNPKSVGGARAADQGASDQDAWSESSAQIFLDAGKEYLKAGKFDQAVVQLNEALNSASEAEASEIHYYLAEASSLNGDVRGAWKELGGLKPRGSETWAGDFVLLKAKLLEDTSAYPDAVEWLNANDLSLDSLRSQFYFFLLGLGYRGMNDEGNAKRALSQAVSLSADSDLGKVAAELIK